MKLLTLTGTSKENGRVHGESLRSDIQEQLGWFRSLLSEYGHVDPDELFARVLTLGWAKAAQRWTPKLLEEVQGIAEGCNLPYQDLFAWNHVQEVYWYVFYKNANVPGEGISGCSALGDVGDENNPTILAQNADTVTFWHQHQTLLRIREPGSDLELLMLAFPGMIGPYGVNNHGIGLCVNALFYNLFNSLHGLGTLFMTRGILSQITYPEAEAFLRTVPHATGNTLTLGGPGQVTAFEVSANQVKPYRLPAQPNRTCHTNHELVNNDFRPGVDREPFPNSVDRLRLVEEGLGKIRHPLTVEDTKTILCTHAEKAQLCRHEDDPNGSMTTFSMIFELSNHPVAHISFGPPCREGYHPFYFEK